MTGHSLGGGLAGLVASIYDRPGLLFDNMPFEQAAKNVEASTNTSFKSDVYGGFGTWDPTISSTSSLKADYIEGEFLGWFRGSGLNPQSAQVKRTTSIGIGTGIDLSKVDNSPANLSLHSTGRTFSGKMLTSQITPVSCALRWPLLRYYKLIGRAA